MVHVSPSSFRKQKQGYETCLADPNGNAFMSWVVTACTRGGKAKMFSCSTHKMNDRGNKTFRISEKRTKLTVTKLLLTVNYLHRPSYSKYLSLVSSPPPLGSLSLSARTKNKHLETHSEFEI